MANSQHNPESSLPEVFHRLKSRPPVLVGLGLALLLFVLFVFKFLHGFSIIADSVAAGYDYFTLPRCGLAMRYGTNPFTASQDYAGYGPWATFWVSHPMMCVFLGIPLSFLEPMAGYWTANAAYLLVHLGTLAFFGSRLSQQNASFKDWIFFGALGFFMPWYSLYHQGQYHALVVLALGLVLWQGKHVVAGFVISAFGKPVLGPAGFVLFVREKWKQVFAISAICAFGFLSWHFVGHNIHDGLHFGTENSIMDKFYRYGTVYLRYNAPRWNQQDSLAVFLDEFFPIYGNLLIRTALAGFATFCGVVLLRNKPIEIAICATSLWFFFLYARGHEYHLTLYVPILCYLYTEERGLYRTRWMAFLAAYVALPSVYVIFKALYGFNSPEEASSDAMANANYPLYLIFTAQRPLAAFLILGTILKTEKVFVRDERDEELSEAI